ncbi:MAG: leucine-rich repeat domain-containing protein, partial [Bacillota bacterium]
MEKIDLRNNEIQDIDILHKLVGLKELLISSNPIKKLDILPKLSNLNTLYISINNETDVQYIRELKNLKKLQIMGVNNYEFLNDLSQVEELSLSGNN